jgi:hypothetical protein
LGLEFAGGPLSLVVLRSVYQKSGGLKPCAALVAPVPASAFGSPPGSLFSYLAANQLPARQLRANERQSRAVFTGFRR